MNKHLLVFTPNTRKKKYNRSIKRKTENIIKKSVKQNIKLHCFTHRNRTNTFIKDNF